MSDPDPAVAYDRLRAETAQMFDYDLANASLTQGLQIDLVSLLRLEIDSMSGAVLAGKTVDLSRLVAAHGLLKQMLPERSLVAPAPPAEVRFSGEHQAKLRRLIEKTVLTPSADDHIAIAERAWKDEQMALAAASDNWTWQPAPLAAATPSAADGGRAQSSDIALRSMPLPAAPADQPPLPKRGEVPAHYLKQDEPWREFVDESGICAPYFRPYG
jgi:hypothetical protein